MNPPGSADNNFNWVKSRLCEATSISLTLSRKAEGRGSSKIEVEELFVSIKVTVVVSDRVRLRCTFMNGSSAVILVDR